MPRKRQQQRSFLSRLGALIFGTAREPQPTRRSLRVESLEHRQLMAADVGNISGVMYRDANNSNSFDGGDVGIAGLQVQLYRDTGNGTFGTNDTLVTSTTTDASGNYEFKDLVFGNYFVRRPAQTATSGVYAGKKFAQSVSAAVTPTSLKTVIDDFTTPTVQTAAVDTTNDNVPGTSVASNIAAAKTLGGEREIVTNFTGNVTGPGILMSARVATIAIAGTPTGLLLLDATSSAKGVYTLVYDGADGVASATPNTANGLGSVNLTKGNADQLRFQLNSLDLPGATVRVNVYSEGNRVSTASLPLLARVMDGVASAGGQTEYAFRFDGTGSGGFSAAVGANGGADFTKVKAITVTIDAQNNDLDAQLKMLGAYGPANSTVNLAIEEVDVSLVKAVSNATPNVGDTVNYTITVTNAANLANGRATVQATGVQVTDLLLTDALNKNRLTFVSDNSGGRFNSTAGIWNVGTLNPGETKSIVIAMRVNQSAVPNVLNTARVTKLDQPDIDTDDWVDSKQITPKFFDIGVTKQVDQTRPNEDDPLAFTIIVRNNGTANASNVKINDVLGGNTGSFQFVSSTPAAGSTFDSASGVWTIPTLNAGQSVQLVIRGTVIECEPFTNTVSLLSIGNGIDSNPANNSSTVNVTPQMVDIGITKTVVGIGTIAANTTPNKANPNVAFRITASNAGPDAATGLVVRDRLPSGLVFVSADTTGYNAATGDWTIGSLASGATRTLVITARLATGLPPASISNTAAVFALDQCDHVSANDSSTVTVNPQVIDLSVTKQVDRPVVTVGENVTWTMTVTNAGPNAATGVSLKDALPTGVTYVTSNTLKGTYNPSSGIWTVGNLGVNESATLTITSTVNVANPQTNTIEVFSANQHDIDSTPNNGAVEDDLATAVVTATPKQIDLSVTKRVDKPTPLVGENVTWTMTVTNSGPHAATGVSLKDALPSGVTFVSASTAKASFNSTTNVWFVGSLAVNETATLTLTTRVNANVPQTNTIEVFTADQPDIDSVPNNGANEDDRASASIAPSDPLIDLSVTKSVNRTTPRVGENVTFLIGLTNSGPNTATGVSLKDVLPSGVTFVSSSATLGTYNAGTGIWTVGTLGVNQTISLSITVTVNVNAIQINTAEVFSADQRDIDSTPNNGAIEDDLARASIFPVTPTPQGDPDPPFSKKLFMAR